MPTNHLTFSPFMVILEAELEPCVRKKPDSLNRLQAQIPALLVEPNYLAFLSVLFIYKLSMLIVNISWGYWKYPTI